MENFKFILRGWFIVFIPICFIVIGSLVVMFGVFGINYIISVITGMGLGWYYWTKSIKRWILWVHSRGIETERIYRIGKMGLLLWKKQTVISVLLEEDFPE